MQSETEPFGDQRGPWPLLVKELEQINWPHSYNFLALLTLFSDPFNKKLAQNKIIKIIQQSKKKKITQSFVIK